MELPSGLASEDPAWRAFLQLVVEVLRDGSHRASMVATAWRVLLDNHRDVLADLLSHLHFATRLSSDAVVDVESALLETMPGDGTVALTWSLQHPDRLRSCIRWERSDDRSRDTMIVLGRIGDEHAADVMRRFVNDPQLGVTAVEAVREIEARYLP